MEGCQGVGCGRGQARWHRKVWAGDEADGEVEGGGRVEGGPPETPRNRAWPFNTFLSLLNQNGVHARNCSKLLETYVLPPGLLWPKTESWPELVLYGSKTTDLPLTFRNLIKTHKITQISQNTTKALKIRQTPAKATNSHLTPKRHPKAVWGPPEFRSVSSSFEDGAEHPTFYQIWPKKSSCKARRVALRLQIRSDLPSPRERTPRSFEQVSSSFEQHRPGGAGHTFHLFLITLESYVSFCGFP